MNKELDRFEERVSKELDRFSKEKKPLCRKKVLGEDFSCECEQCQER